MIKQQMVLMMWLMLSACAQSEPKLDLKSKAMMELILPKLECQIFKDKFIDKSKGLEAEQGNVSKEMDKIYYQALNAHCIKSDV